MRYFAVESLPARAAHMSEVRPLSSIASTFSPLSKAFFKTLTCIVCRVSVCKPCVLVCVRHHRRNGNWNYHANRHDISNDYFSRHNNCHDISDCNDDRHDIGHNILDSHGNRHDNRHGIVMIFLIAITTVSSSVEAAKCLPLTDNKNMCAEADAHTMQLHLSISRRGKNVQLSIGPGCIRQHSTL